MNEISDVQPTSINHIIGQQSVVAQVEVAIDAAFADGKKFDSALLVGPPGVGKSALANVIAQEMASDFDEVLGQSIKSPADLNALLLRATDKAVIHIDEAHELQRSFQTAMYLALDKRRVFLPGSGKSGSLGSIPIADFTLLLSTTDEFRLLQPLRDRMKLVLKFEFYTIEELTVMLGHRSRAVGWEIEEEILPVIAQRSRGTPRLALRLLQSARRVSRAEGESRISSVHLGRACGLEQIDHLGLGPIEQKYLAILSEGPIRLNVIASMLGLPPKTVSQVTEPFLIRSGLVMKDDNGRRQLSAKGREHLLNSHV